MKATKEFFESLREEINASSPVVTETQEQPSARKLRVIDLFVGVGGLDLSNADLQLAFTKIEAEMNVKDAEIENLKAQLRTRASETAVMKSQLEMQRIEYDARELGITPEELRANPKPVPPKVQAQWDAETMEDLNRAEDDPEAYSNELIQMLEEAKQRETELMNALGQERRKHEESDGIERLPMTAFIAYAEEHYPADQNPRAKVLKEALGDVFNIRKIDDDAYERWKQLGTKESFDERMADSMNRIAERPQMKDNNGIVAGGNLNANFSFTNEQVQMLINQLSLTGEQSSKLLNFTNNGNNNTR